jgi:hypothetical protein
VCEFFRHVHRKFVFSFVILCVLATPFVALAQSHTSISAPAVHAKGIWIEPKQCFLANQGWMLTFHSAAPLIQFEYKTADLDDWNPADGEDRQFHANVGFFDEEGAVDVRGKTSDGRTVGPFHLTFDALAAVRDEDYRNVRSMPATWVQFNDRYAYFSALFSSNCGLREVRYSFDSKDLDKRMPLPPCSLRRHGYMPKDDSEVVKLETTPTYIAVQLVYYDGTVSPVSVIRKGLH